MYKQLLYIQLLINSNKMDLIDYQGTSFESLTRGLIGMISLLLIAYLISSNRKKIKWKDCFNGSFYSNHYSNRCYEN